MKAPRTASAEHVFRMPKPSAAAIKQAQGAFLKEQTEAYQKFADYRRHRGVIEKFFITRLYAAETIDAKVKRSVEALRSTRESRIPATVRDAPFAGPPIFQMKPGINLIGPPYDFGLNVALGTNRPMIHNGLGSGVFSISATALPGGNTFGAAGVGLFIVPSKPAKTLSIRPYYTWFYKYTCESDGPPTAHSTGVISASVSGRMKNGTSSGFPGKSKQLWSAGSDLWDDAHGEDTEVFRLPESELVVSGFDFYTVSYSCQVSADANESDLFSAVSYNQLGCRVPFIVVEEF